MGRRSDRTAIGRAGEEAAAAFLAARGYRILARNVRFRTGEIDLVAEEAGALVFVEVKTRLGLGFGTAAEAITPQKQRQLVRLAAIYLAMHHYDERPCRFDVVTVESDGAGGLQCKLIQNAFIAS